MNWDTVSGNWLELKGRLREKWGKLTDQDLESIGGMKDQLIGALELRYGFERERASQEIDRWLETMNDRIAGRREPPKTH